MTPCCQAKWEYTVRASATSSCESCGPELELEVSRECSKCHHRGQYLTIKDFAAPVSFTSPEWDAWSKDREWK